MDTAKDSGLIWKQVNDRFFKTLIQSEDQERLKLVLDSIQQYPNHCRPPVLFALSGRLFKKGERQSALFWYSLAHLRTLMSMNIGTEEMKPYAQKVLSLYEGQFGRAISRYAVRHIDQFKQARLQAANFAPENSISYDPRWIYIAEREIHNPQILKQIIKPRRLWKSIRQQTIVRFRQQLSAKTTR